MAKTTIITGSTSGIGLGIARCFAAAGYQIVFNGLEENGADIAAEVGEEFKVNTYFSSANMLEPAQIQSLVREAEERFGGVDVLINNAGVQHVAPIDEFPQQKWDLILGVNLSAAFHTCRAVWPGMKQKGFGRIINIASVHGLRASPFKSAYVAAKHGMVGLTKVLALEGAPHGITCNAICPGYVETPLVKDQVADQAKAHNMSEAEVVGQVMLKQHAVKEFVPIQTLGDMALFLAEPSVGTITGTALPVDAGWTA